MADLSFQCVSYDKTATCDLIPLLKLNRTGTGLLPEVERQAKPSTSLDMFRFSYQRDSSTLARGLESLALSAHWRQQQSGILQRFSNRFQLRF